ncbi:MAG: DUF6584 family protein [Armatimonadota bacterium]
MTRTSAIERVEEDIRQGDLGKARDRLHGLIAANPGNLELRSKLGDAYSRLQFPEMAGRYWYLEEHPTESMLAAIRKFESSMGNDPVQILSALKIRISADELPPHARQKIMDLQERSLKTYGSYPVYEPKTQTKWLESPNKKRQWDFYKYGCIAVLILIVVSAVIGLWTVIGYFIN